MNILKALNIANPEAVRNFVQPIEDQHGKRLATSIILQGIAQLGEHWQVENYLKHVMGVNPRVLFLVELPYDMSGNIRGKYVIYQVHLANDGLGNAIFIIDAPELHPTKMNLPVAYERYTLAEGPARELSKAEWRKIVGLDS